MIKSTSETVNSSLSSFSEEQESSTIESPPNPFSPNNDGNERTNHGKQPVHKIEPVLDMEKKKFRVFLEDGSLSEYSIKDMTTAEELMNEMSNQHGLSSDMRRYRLTLNEINDVSWRSIHYIRPHQKLREIFDWPCMKNPTVCTLRVVIVPARAEILAETEPITFTYLYRQSINDYVRERAGSEITVDIAVQLTTLLILDESLCTGVRPTSLLKRSWLLNQLFPRSLLEQYSLKQLISRIRTQLQTSAEQTQLSVAKEFIRIFSENTRSFAGKLFPVKFPDKHRDSILLISPRYPVAIVDQARRMSSPVVPLISAWSHLSRVIIKQYRNGVAVRLITAPKSNNFQSSTLLQQEIAFLIHSNLLNDLMTFIEGYSQLESFNVPLAIEQVSAKSQRKPDSTDKTVDHSPKVSRLFNSKKTHQTYRIVQEKSVPNSNSSLLTLTKQFFNRHQSRLLDVEEQETVSNVPNRTTLVTWRSLADTQPNVCSLPAPVLYRTVINVESTGEERMKSNDSDEDDNDCNEPDIIDLTTSCGYYGSLSFPLRPPSPFNDGLIWQDMPNPVADEQFDQEIFIWSPETQQLSIHYNTNNNNNNEIQPISPTIPRTNQSWKRVWHHLFKRNSSKRAQSQQPSVIPYDFGTGEKVRRKSRASKRVHWPDEDQRIRGLCSKFVDHLKQFVRHVIHDQPDNTHWRQCQAILEQLDETVDCHELRQAFLDCLVIAEQGSHSDLIRQQTLIADSISRIISSSTDAL